MRLVACSACHTQYDVSDATGERITCRCGAQIEVRERESKDLEVHRCSGCGAHVAVGADDCDYCGSQIVRDPRLLSLICPECCARNANDARFCGACGVAFDPQPAADEKPELPCPVCSSRMSARRVGDVGIDECPKCNGVWCPEDRFEALVERAIAARQERTGAGSGEPEAPASATARAPRVAGANPAAQGVAYRRCPVCDAFMQRRNFRKTSGVITDRCHEHGTWLDADELEQIAGYVLSGGRPQAEAAMRYAEARDRDEFRRARIAKLKADPSSFHEVHGDNSMGWQTFAGLIESLFH